MPSYSSHVMLTHTMDSRTRKLPRQYHATLERYLARQQEDISKKIATETGNDHKSLSDSFDRKQVLDELARQKDRLTNLVDRATQVSQQAETAEPLLSSQIYDTLRKFSQATAKDVKEIQEHLLNRGLMTRSLFDRLKESSEQDGAKLEEIASGFSGVEKSFAIQAGREVRIVVVPEAVDDARATALSEEIAKRIENELQYPGQIKVTVIVRGKTSITNNRHGEFRHA